MSSNPIWQDTLQELEATISRPNFVTWLKSSDLTEDGPGLLTITVRNSYAKSWVEKNALTQIKPLLAKHFAEINQLRVAIASTLDTALDDLPILQSNEEIDEKETETAEVTSKIPPTPRSFNPKYTFESFIVGNNNRLAFAAATSVADKPGEAYNPLFLYGGVGLGKTHLMQAIGNKILDHSPKKKIIYISCESFGSEYVEAIQHKTMNEFKRKYRNVDVFLIDDIQFLANKEGTQEEFFHTFNTLHQSNRQIVMTADRMPKEIGDLEDRLVSRIGWGMVADIQSPNFENRVAILQAKAETMGVEINPAVLDYIASTITNNVRELEGSLTKLVKTAEVEDKPVTLALAKDVLKNMASQSQRHFTDKKIIQTVAAHFDINASDILGSRRTKEVVYPRQIVMYLCRELLGKSHPQIGDLLGGKDHTTIMHGSNKISVLIKTDGQVERDVRTITTTLEEGG